MMIIYSYLMKDAPEYVLLNVLFRLFFQLALNVHPSLLVLVPVPNGNDGRFHFTVKVAVWPPSIVVGTTPTVPPKVAPLLAAKLPKEHVSASDTLALVIL